MRKVGGELEVHHAPGEQGLVPLPGPRREQGEPRRQQPQQGHEGEGDVDPGEVVPRRHDAIFADQIVQSSPTLGPILHFLLKNGASLGYYLLVRDDMNWPFASETPLTVESFKLGAAITF